MSGAARRRLLLALVASLTLSGCAAAGDPYPLPVPPPHAGQNSPAAVGEAVPAVVLFIELRPGDRIELIRAEPIGLADGATVEFFYSPNVQQGDEWLVGERLEPLPGAFAHAASPTKSPENAFGIVARITAQRPGRFVLEAVGLRYRLNDGPERVGEGIDVVFTVCADNPKPPDCPIDEPEG